MSSWGGKRKGAGRPKGSTKFIHNQRKQRQLRAFDEEWEKIKIFIKIVRDDPERAERMLQTQ